MPNPRPRGQIRGDPAPASIYPTLWFEDGLKGDLMGINVYYGRAENGDVAHENGDVAHFYTIIGGYLKKSPCSMPGETFQC